MGFDLDDTLDLLARTPAVLDRLLRGTSAAWHDRDEGAATWSPWVVVGHLIHGEETDWVPRARLSWPPARSAPSSPSTASPSWCAYLSILDR